MRRARRSAAPLGLALLLVLAAGGCKSSCSRGRALAGSVVGFEGQIDEETTGAHPEHITYFSKGVRSRMEHPGRIRIWDGETKLTYGLDTATKTYTVKPYDFDTKAASDAGGGWVRTGRTDVIAGHRCQVLETAPKAGSKSREEACLADDIEVLGFGAAPLTGLTGLRMRLVIIDATGVERNRTEVTRVEGKHVDDSVFEVPAGYSKEP